MEQIGLGRSHYSQIKTFLDAINCRGGGALLTVAFLPHTIPTKEISQLTLPADDLVWEMVIELT